MNVVAITTMVAVHKSARIQSDPTSVCVDRDI